MTKKDYVLIAEAVRSVKIDSKEPRPISALADSLAATLAADNPRFDRARFLAACGVQS